MPNLILPRNQVHVEQNQGESNSWSEGRGPEDGLPLTDASFHVSCRHKSPDATLITPNLPGRPAHQLPLHSVLVNLLQNRKCWQDLTKDGQRWESTKRTGLKVNSLRLQAAPHWPVAGRGAHSLSGPPLISKMKGLKQSSSLQDPQVGNSPHPGTC